MEFMETWVKADVFTFTALIYPGNIGNALLIFIFRFDFFDLAD